MNTYAIQVSQDPGYFFPRKSEGEVSRLLAERFFEQDFLLLDRLLIRPEKVLLGKAGPDADTEPTLGFAQPLRRFSIQVSVRQVVRGTPLFFESEFEGD